MLILTEWQQTLQQEAPIAESQGSLTRQQLEVLQRMHAFRLFLPKNLNGLALSLPDGLRFEESLAHIDGSLGWTLTLCAGATLFAGYMQPSLVEDLLKNPLACLGGSGTASGIAVAENDGFRISGFWKYATGAPHLTAFTANCKIWRDGCELLDEKGQPEIRAFVFKKEEVRIHEDWHTMGLRATASHSFEVPEQWFPAKRAFQILPEQARLPEPVFQYPFQAFAEATLAANYAGMTQHFLDCCKHYFFKKSARDPQTEPFLKKLFQETESTFQGDRNRFYQAVAFSWKECCTQKFCSKKSLSEVAKTSRALALISRETAARLFPYCGMAALHPESEINRVWRDIFTASQHSLLHPIA